MSGLTVDGHPVVWFKHQIGLSPFNTRLRLSCHLSREFNLAASFGSQTSQKLSIKLNLWRLCKNNKEGGTQKLVYILSIRHKGITVRESWYLWDPQPGSHQWPCRADWLRDGSGRGLCRRTIGPQSDQSPGTSVLEPYLRRAPTYRFPSDNVPHCIHGYQYHHRTLVAPRSGRYHWQTCPST